MAYIRSEGHISYWIPREGNFISFWIEQRRNFDLRNSEKQLAAISKTFREVSASLGISPVVKAHQGEAVVHPLPMGRTNIAITTRTPVDSTVSQSRTISNPIGHLINECFVAGVTFSIQYATPQGGCVGDDGMYRFLFSIFPTERHAKQWLNRIEQSTRPSSHPPVGLGFAPMHIENVVIEYQRYIYDAPNAPLRDKLVKSLEKLDPHNTKPKSN